MENVAIIAHTLRKHLGSLDVYHLKETEDRQLHLAMHTNFRDRDSLEEKIKAFHREIYDPVDISSIFRIFKNEDYRTLIHSLHREDFRSYLGSDMIESDLQMTFWCYRKSDRKEIFRLVRDLIPMLKSGQIDRSEMLISPTDDLRGSSISFLDSVKINL